jgi:hypothetical protein
MYRDILGRGILLFLAVMLLPAAARPYRGGWDPDLSLDGPLFKAGALQFNLPDRWINVPGETSARVGQWSVAPLRGQAGDGGQVVCFYFGPGVGGTVKENIDDWIGSIFNAEGHPAAAEVKHRQTRGVNISQVVVFGTYNQAVPIPGIPPISKPDYGLIGTVLENPQGNVYWRFTGPESLITANLPLFNRMIDSVKPVGK